MTLARTIPRSIVRPFARPLLWVPSPSLYIDFLAGQFGNGQFPVTFTRASTAAYFGADGLLKSAAVDMPRFDYDPVTLAPKGLLVEESRTNLLVRSTDPSAASWAAVGSGCTVNVGAGPRGLSRVTANAASSAIAQTITVAAGSAITVSFWAKADNVNFARVRINGASDNVAAWFDLANGSVGTNTAGSGNVVYSTHTIRNLGDGVYECRLTVTTTTETSFTVYFFPVSANGASSATGNAIFQGEYQAEVGAFPTSRIRTTSATVTRSADVCSIALGAWFSASQGTSLLEGRLLSVTSGNPGIRYDDGTDNNRIMQRIGSSGSFRLTVVSAGTEVADIARAITAGADFRHAGAYAADDYATCLNGGTVGTDTSGALPTGLTTLRFSGVVGSSYFNGHIRRIAYYPRRLSNAQLQAITGA